MKWKSPNKFTFDVELLLHELLSCIAIDSTSITFSNLLAEEYLATLESIIKLNKNIPNEFKRRMLTDSLKNIKGKNEEISCETLERELRRQESLYLGKTQMQYVLMTSLSICANNKLPLIRNRGCSISFSKKSGSKFDKEREKIGDLQSRTKGFHYLKNYLNVRVRVLARSEEEAFYSAIDELDFVRGVWNLHANSVSKFSMGSNNLVSVNKISLGLAHTLHFLDGSLVSPHQQQYWYEPFFKDKKPFDFSKNNYRIVQAFNKFRKKIRNHPYRSSIEEAVIRYSRSLDYSDYYVSFVKLWGVLEFLTDTEKSNYDVTIRRAVFLWKEHKLHTQILNHLKEIRNQYVHNGESPFSSRTEFYIYQLKRYVEHLILYHSSRKGFYSIAETARLLDLSPDTSILKQKQEEFRKAIKFRSS